MATKNVFSDNTQTVLSWMQVNGSATAADIAEATGIPVRSVNGIITSALKRRGLADREVVEGQKAKVCFLTEEGIAADPFATIEE